jgi:hypothetical protein
VTSSIAVRISVIANGSPASRAKLFTFLTDPSLLEGRTFNSHHPSWRDVRQVSQIWRTSQIQTILD